MSKFAFVFPGQGSQKIGMLSELAQTYPAIQETFEEASDVLGFDLWQLSSHGPEAQLNQTENTQPAILTASIAIWRVWLAQGGPKPCLLAGHSLGEYSALVCADVFSFADAVSLVHQRGLFMQKAVASGEGAMAAIIGLDDRDIIECCTKAQSFGTVSPANYNSIGQTVIAGKADAVEKAAELAKTAGARKVVMLAVSVPSHCALMASAAAELKNMIDSMKFENAQIPIINNIDAKIETTSDAIKSALVSQLTEPVQWVKTIQKMAGENILEVTECGPGKVLTGMNRRIDKQLNYNNINTPEHLQKFLTLQT